VSPPVRFQLNCI